MNSTQRSSLLPWERSIVGRGKSLQHWKRWLKNPSIPIRKRIIEAIQSGHIPAHILHHFACDCYEERFRHFMPIIPKFYTQALESKRRWIEGKESTKALDNYLEELCFYPLSDETHIAEELQRFTRAMLSKDPFVSARYCSESFLLEPLWQCNNLHDKLSEFIEWRTQLAHLIYDIGCHRNPTLQRWSQRFEDVLFSQKD